VLSSEAIKPDAQRLNPMNVLRKLFSMRSIYDAFKSTFKLVVFLAVGAYVVYGILASTLSSMVIEPSAQFQYLMATTVDLMTYMCIALVSFALVDVIYTRREFAKQMRMSKRELTDEHKNREGDPRIRMRLRELRQQMLQRTTALRQVKSADVLITNPTHFAVALKYDEQVMESPQLVAKGAGLIALAMRRVASRHRIPVIENPALARALYRRAEISAGIPHDMYAQIAKILVWVLALRKLQQRGSAT
jgi:flagellar biosynthesis protein FlhB